MGWISISGDVARKCNRPLASKHKFLTKDFSLCCPETYNKRKTYLISSLPEIPLTRLLWEGLVTETYTIREISMKTRVDAMVATLADLRATIDSPHKEACRDCWVIGRFLCVRARGRVPRSGLESKRTRTAYTQRTVRALGKVWYYCS